MTSLVIPLKPSKEANPLLARSLPTALAALPELRPVLIGQPHRWDPEARVIHYEQNSADPVTNTTAMLEAACYHEGVTDPFVWSNDDIFWTQPVSLLDVYRAGLTTRGFLGQFPGEGVYAVRSATTAAKLRELGRPQWDYERHVPMLVHKEKMRLALRQHREGAIRSFYGNLYRDDPFAMEPDVKAWEAMELRALMLANVKWFSVASDYDLDHLDLMVRSWGSS